MAIFTRKRLKMLTAVTTLLCGAWAAAGLVFRATAYSSMPVAPNEPYGAADVLELLHYAGLLGFSGLAVLQGLVLLVFARFDLRRLGVLILLFGLALPFSYGPIHSWVASWAVR